MRTRLLGVLFLATVGLCETASAAPQLLLTWVDGSSNEAGFKIERKIGSGGTFSQIAVAGANVTSYTDVNLSAGTTYCYRVRAYNSAGNSAYSNQDCATATASSFTLTVTKSGSGTVNSTPSGITCGSDCSQSYSSTTSVTLTATPATGSTFGGWSGGGCSGTGNCTLLINANTTVTATFNTSTTQNFTLTVTKAGTGSGTVNSTPAGIACGSDCSQSYPKNTVVILVAAPASGSVFGGWSGGGCSGTGSCKVTLTAAKTVTATFTKTSQSYTLTVKKAGTGSGTVNSTPTGVACGTDCSQSYLSNTVVTLTAVPATGSAFTGWSGGGCSGTGSCVVTLAASMTVTATFNITNTTSYTLTVKKAGTGKGTVYSGPEGIVCGSDCSQSYPKNTVVILVAAPASGSVFGGWSGGGCSGKVSHCLVTLTASTTVTATFK